MKDLFKKHRYLLHSASLLIAALVMLAFDSDDIVDFLVKSGGAFWYALLTGLGIYILSAAAMWLLYPFVPKHEDFSSSDERKQYFDLGKWDLLLFIFSVIVITIVFSGLVQ